MAEWRRVVREDLAAPSEQGGGGGGGKERGQQHGRRNQQDDTTTGGGRRGRPGRGRARGELASAWVEEQGGYLSLPEVDISGAEEFMGEFVNKSRPAVIKVTSRTHGPSRAPDCARVDGLMSFWPSGSRAQDPVVDVRVPPAFPVHAGTCSLCPLEEVATDATPLSCGLRAVCFDIFFPVVFPSELSRRFCAEGGVVVGGPVGALRGQHGAGQPQRNGKVTGGRTLRSCSAEQLAHDTCTLASLGSVSHVLRWVGIVGQGSARISASSSGNHLRQSRGFFPRKGYT